MNRVVICALLVFTLVSLVLGQGSFTLDYGKAQLYHSYVSYCEPQTLANWQCYWCKFIPGAQLVQTFEDADTDTFGYAAIVNDGSKNQLVVAFRGTQPQCLENWITNLNMELVPLNSSNPKGPQVHQGYYSAYNAIRSQLVNALTSLMNQCPTCNTTVVTGHSLGGALAEICALDLATMGKFGNIQLVTFGEPRPGDPAFAYLVDSKISVVNRWRVTNQRDIVVHIPPRAVGYWHYAPEVWFANDITHFKICDQTGEDVSCSISVWADSITDHLTYFGIDQRDGKDKPDCQPVPVSCRGK